MNKDKQRKEPNPSEEARSNDTLNNAGARTQQQKAIQQTAQSSESEEIR